MIDRLFSYLAAFARRIVARLLSRRVDDEVASTADEARRKRYTRVVEYSEVESTTSQQEAMSLLERRQTALAIVCNEVSDKWLMLWCPCGCHRVRRISVSRSVQPAWYLYRSDNGLVSLRPSVHLQVECCVHFVLTNSKAYVLSSIDDRHISLPNA